MSLVYDKGKYRHSVGKKYSKIDQNNNNIIYKNNIDKNNNNKNPIKNNTLYAEYISSSPPGNNNKKKSQYLTTFQNNDYIHKNKRNINETINSINNKISQIGKLNFNKSFEGNLRKDYKSKNFNFSREGLFRMKNNENQKKINKSMIINHKNKIKNRNKKNIKSASKAIKAHNTLNHKKNNFAEKLLIKKLEDKFKSLEKNIIDKKYESEIDNEEMIITSRKDEKGSNTARLQIKGRNLINDNLDLNLDYENIWEIKLLIEKMMDIQKSYHKELDLLLTRYNYNSKMLKSLIEKIKVLQKKIFLIKKIKESRENKVNMYNYLDKYNHNNQHDIYKINKNEFNLWNFILNEEKRKNKEKLKNIFKKVIFERYHKISGKINNIENKIVLNLMKKYHYNLKGKGSGIKSNNNNTNISIFHNQRQNINKNLNTNKYKKSINKNKKHKKTTSCLTKPSKYTYFKNNQKPK